MRSLLVAGLAFSVALLLGAPAPSHASCGDTSCVPSCWNATVRLRPDMTRTVSVQCDDTTSAELVTPPAHTVVSNVSTDFYGFHFDARPDPDAPRDEDAVFEIGGYGGSIEQSVHIEVVPLSENSPPVCEGDRVTQRSDGTGPVEVLMHPYCYDPDGDGFVMQGGPPGVHLQSPENVPAGSSEQNWRYRTATFSGDETTTVWATDDLGARSADAQLDVTVGPAVDSPPECHLQSWGSLDPTPLYSRPGRTRHFPIICGDADADPFTARLSSPPQHGTITLNGGTESSFPSYQADDWIDTTYVPADDSLEPDPFSVRASGPRGDGPEARIEIVPRPPTENGWGGCGWGPATLEPGRPAEIGTMCSDEEGDPLSAKIVSGPHHGTIGAPVLAPWGAADESVSMQYVPDEDYQGPDWVIVEVTDGYGLVVDVGIEITVKHTPYPVETSPGPPPPPVPSVPPVPPVTRPGQARHVAQRILGTAGVKRLRSARGTEVWARSQLSRRDLVRYGRTPGMAVVCVTRCQVRSTSRLPLGVPSVRSSAQKAATSTSPREPQVLWLIAGRTERRALRRRRRAHGTFAVGIRPSPGPATSLKRSIPLSR